VAAKCKVCGKDVDPEMISFCSKKCLFESIKLNSSSNDAPLENWDSDPWV